ncbi:MAG TPA: hypothetical protein ENN06_06575 [Desulfobacteraceae bacterium]|nr:hypothetical protein [Desulfobacteraceae bacterium]
MLRKKIPQLFLVLLLFNLIVLIWPAPRCHALEAGQAEEPAPPEMNNNDFNYLLEGRPDPFKPFIEPEVATKVDPNEIIDEEVELTGMQLFEPGQLALVAVMFAGEKKIAMVEDVTGKGYVINEGVLIGRHGVVSEIRGDQVIVTETARTRAGNEIVTTVVMRLKKEGDK